MSEHYDKPATIDARDTTGVRTDARTLFAIVATAVTLSLAGGVAWASLKGDVAGIAEKHEKTERIVNADHDLLNEVHAAQAQQTKLLESIVAGRDRRATSTPAEGPGR